MSGAPARASEADVLIEFRGASLGYGRRVVLDGVSFAIRRGTFTGIVGPNGSGKSTLLRAALALDAPLRGSVERPPGASLRIGYVPQRARIDPIFPLRVRDLVAMGRYPHAGALRRAGPRDVAVIDDACRRVGIERLADRPFRDLSGGQQQRTLIARALATEPDLLVLDEPTNGMDLASEHSICEVIESLHRECGTAVLFVTHLLHLVADAASELVLLAPVRDGGAGEPSRFVRGGRDEILTGSALSAIYGMPIEVHRIAGRTIVAPPREGTAR